MPPSPDSTTKQALAKIRELKQKLAEAGSARNDEPIAIVSTACRFPRSSTSPEAFWNSLMDGTDEVTELPPDRWDLEAYYDEDPDTPGKMYARKGVFLDSIDEMDADFFGISPREATWIDPQQRLFLEVGWEALERAGWASEEAGKNTGVFVGWMHNDYQNEASELLHDLNPYIATGSAGSFLCGRLSYYLGIQGPSLAIDTACSSSLVALHLACQSLRLGECDRALVGGVNAMVSPKTTIMTCKLHALSPSGHSRAFDASADGYLRGEGCGVIAIRRLSDAERDGDPILGVIRGSAITHNGSSSGLTAPNPDSQQKVIRQALAQAKVDPSEIGYLEAHGTGTELGDPIEMNAAATVLGEGRKMDDPLLVGSVKTNLGHLEAAAGIAGIIKTVLSFQHGTIPRHLHFETPNPHIAWDRLPVKIVTENMAWPEKERRIAGVSAFGMSGTNAHIVLEDYQSTGLGQSPNPVESNKPLILPLSGKNEDALREVAAGYRDFLSSNEGIDFAAVCRAAATGKRHFEQRAAVVAKDVSDAIEKLSAISGGAALEAPARPNPMVAWQFTGQGSQYQGMAKGLYETEPVFKKALDDCAAALAEHRDGDLIDIILNDGELLGDTYWTQPALFSIHIALAELMKSRGLKPDAVLGHSLGQYAAACVAGMLDWRDGMRLIHERARLVGSLPEGGAMAAVFSDIEEAPEGLSIAARNGSHTVISGPEEAVDAAIANFGTKDIRTKKLDTSHAFHSALLDPILDEFEKVADSIEFQPAEIPLVCNVSGEILPASQIVDGKYWRGQLREAVQFKKSIETLTASGCEVVLELGPQPHLTGMARACWSGNPEALVPTLKRDSDNALDLAEATGKLYCLGVSLDFSTFGEAGKLNAPLPTYPFQRQRYWGPEIPGKDRVADKSVHPLLGAERALAGVQNQRRYESRMSPDRPQWLGDHRVFDDIVFPGAAYVEMMTAAAPFARVLENINFEVPLMIAGPVTVQTIVDGTGEGGTVEIHSVAEPGAPWMRNVSASIGEAQPDIPTKVDLAELEKFCPEVADTAQFYEMFDALGIQYGPEFQTIRSLHYGDGDVLSKLQLTSDYRGFSLPPMLLDGAFNSLAVGLLLDPNSSLFLPVGIEKFHRFGPLEGDLWSYGRWHESEGEIRTADLTLFDENGNVVAFIEKLRVRAVSRTALRQMVGSGPDRLLYNLSWKPTTMPAASDRAGTWLVVGEDDEWTDALAGQLGEQNQICIRAILGETDEPKFSDRTATLSGTNYDHWAAVMEQYFPGEEQGRINGVVWSTGQSGDVDSEAYTKLHCAGMLAFLKILRDRRVEYLDRGFQIITQNAISVADDESVDPESTQFWGFGRVVGHEYPPLRCRIVDFRGADEMVSDVATVLMTEFRENQIAVRPGQIFVPRLVSSQAATIGEGLPIEEDASYLITGGLGMLGRRAGEWLAQRGAKHVVLVSRREPTESTKEMIAEIEETGCKIHVMLADIGVRESLEMLLRKIDAELPPLRGIIHAAGILEDALLVEQDWESFERVLAPKKHGARMLHELTSEEKLDFFILYSSAASVMGSPGQANYATANAYLDGLAYARTVDGLTTLSVNFGPWNEGMAATETVTKASELQGMTPLTADEAHEAVERLIDNGLVQATMLDVDWSRMRMRFPVEAPPLFDELWPDRIDADPGHAVLVEKLREADASGESREDIIREHVQNELQQVLSLPNPPGLDVPLAELGIDSLMAVEFATRLQQQVGRQHAIPPTLAFDYPTVTRLTEHLLNLIDATPVEAETISVTTQSEDEAVAIVGIGCRFPGADGPEAYWDLLRNGIDATCEVPEGRWDMERLYSPDPANGKMYTKRGGFLPDIDKFDAEFFGLSESDAAWMDPQHRMLLETSWQAMEDAGIVPGQNLDANVGVFMGIMSTDYAQLREQLDPDLIAGSQGAGMSHSAGVGRLSYMFGFEGPAVAVDTASSSSLVAVCQAARSLMDGDCNVALAGGVNAILSPTNSLLLCKGGVLSADGRSKSFSAAADGFGRGEGCGIVVLKRRSDAERDGDRILAVIRGTAIGHNGQNGGLTAPSGRAQQNMIRKALGNAGLNPTEVDYLEAHATGTELGDPIEVRAAAEVLGKGREEENALLIGSAKAHMGHLEAAGGISGLIKVVLSMQNGVIPGQIHFDEPSPHIPWDRIRAKVVAEEMKWPNPDRMIAGVSALGMTGTNAHVILEGAPRNVSHSTSAPARPAHLLAISAKSPEALRALALRYSNLLGRIAKDEFVSLCETAGTGRKHHPYRVGIVASSPEEAAEQLSSAKVSEAGDVKIGWHFPAKIDDLFGSGKELYETEPVFKATLDECGSSIAEALFENESKLESNEAAVFAFQMALAALWKSWGVEPDLVYGEGVGQFAAACAAGTMDWEDGFKLAVERDKALAAGLTEEALDAFEQFADTLDNRPPECPLVCDLSGKIVPVHKVLAGTHWRSHLETEADADAVQTTVAEAALNVIVEIGSGQSDCRSKLEDLAELYILGLVPDFATLFKPWHSGKLQLPEYPFQRKRYWITEVKNTAPASQREEELVYTG